MLKFNNMLQFTREGRTSGAARVLFEEVDTVSELKEESLVRELGFLADRSGDILEGGELLHENDPSKVLRDTADRLELLYLTEASELALKHPDYLALSGGGLKDRIQKAAGMEGWMINEAVVDGVCATLRIIAKGEKATRKQRANALLLLEYVSWGTLKHTNWLQQCRLS